MNSYAAHLLAYALDQHFPECLREGGDLTDITFKYRFHNTSPVPEDFIPYLEETMRSLAKEEPELRVQDMVGSNAAGLLEANRQPLMAERVEDEETVSLVKIKDSFDVAIGEIEQKPIFFKLLSLKPLDDGYEIEGVAFDREDELKSFLKKWKLREKIDLAKEKWVYQDEEGFDVFLPKGMAFREEILSQIPFEEERAEVKGILAEKADELIQALRPKKFPLILQNWNDGQEFSLIFLESQDLAEGCSSSLQRIQKTVNILPFETQVTLCGLRPPNDVSERVKELWIQGVRALKSALDNAGIPYREDRKGGPRGPEVNIVLLDELKARFEGPWLQIDCITSEKIGKVRYAPSTECAVIVRSLVPDLDQLAIKMMEQKLLNRS